MTRRFNGSSECFEVAQARAEQRALARPSVAASRSRGGSSAGHASTSPAGGSLGAPAYSGQTAVGTLVSGPPTSLSLAAAPGSALPISGVPAPPPRPPARTPWQQPPFVCPDRPGQGDPTTDPPIGEWPGHPRTPHGIGFKPKEPRVPEGLGYKWEKPRVPHDLGLKWEKPRVLHGLGFTDRPRPLQPPGIGVTDRPHPIVPPGIGLAPVCPTGYTFDPAAGQCITALPSLVDLPEPSCMQIVPNSEIRFEYDTHTCDVFMFGWIQFTYAFAYEAVEAAVRFLERLEGLSLQERMYFWNEADYSYEQGYQSSTPSPRTWFGLYSGPKLEAVQYRVNWLWHRMLPSEGMYDWLENVKPYHFACSVGDSCQGGWAMGEWYEPRTIALCSGQFVWGGAHWSWKCRMVLHEFLHSVGLIDVEEGGASGYGDTTAKYVLKLDPDLALRSVHNYTSWLYHRRMDYGTCDLPPS